MDGLSEPEAIAMSRRERDVLVELRNVRDGTVTQAEAARRLKLGVRQVRRNRFYGRWHDNDGHGIDGGLTLLSAIQQASEAVGR